MAGDSVNRLLTLCEKIAKRRGEGEHDRLRTSNHCLSHSQLMHRPDNSQNRFICLTRCLRGSRGLVAVSRAADGAHVQPLSRRRTVIWSGYAIFWLHPVAALIRRDGLIASLSGRPDNRCSTTFTTGTIPDGVTTCFRIFPVPKSRLKTRLQQLSRRCRTKMRR